MGVQEILFRWQSCLLQALPPQGDGGASAAHGAMHPGSIRAPPQAFMLPPRQKAGSARRDRETQPAT